ncbi:MAG: PAS domain S-box protein [Nitrospirota bacterium]|nr:PAS domain S-box protein [Nitrospirota bacterium]
MSSTGPLSEVESLRLQVVALTRTLAERDQALQDGPEQANLLRAIVEGTSADIGVEFFRSLVKHLTQTLNVRYAFVGEWREQIPGKVSTLAVWSGTDFADPFDYDLKGSPCEHVIGQRLCLHESGVQERFPDDHLLVQLGVQSYCGMPLFDRSGTALGLLVVMDDRPFTRIPLIKDLLQVFAMRAAAELQRQRAETTLCEQGRRLCFTQFSLDHAADAVLWADDSTKFIYANEAACQSLGYTNEELLTLSIPDIAPHHDPVQFHKRLDQLKRGPAVTYESVHRRKDGTEFPIEVSVTYLEHDGRGYTCGIVRNITERKQIEQERLQALHDLQNIMETVPDFMFTLDLQGNMVKWNRRVEEVTGYSSKELLNMSALAFVPPEAAARTAAAIHRAFTEGYAELDGELLTKDRRLIPYHWTGALLKNLQGEPIGITGIGRDVTEKKRSEAALQQERQHLVEAQALAHLGSWDWDIDSGDVQGSDEQFRIFGHEPGRFAVKFDMFLASLHPDDHDRVLAAINDALLGTHPYDLEYRIVRPNGEVRSIHARGDVHRDETGHPIRMAGTVLDITERKQVERALHASEERWHLAVQGSNDGIWDWNIQTGAVFFSPRWKAMRGFEDHEISNHLDEWRSRIHPDDLDRVLQGVDAYLAKEAPEFSEEYRIQRKDGSYMWILDRGVALWTDDGTPCRMTGSESDISERKQALLLLAQQESLLRSILEAEPECVKRVAADGTLLQMNGAGLCFIETEFLEQVVGRSVYDLVAPEFLDQFRSMHEAVVLGAPQQLEFQIIGLKGTRRWMETHAVPLWNPIDHRVEHLAITRDITERKRAEESIRQNRTLLQSFVEHTPAAVAMLDRDLQYVAVSKRWYQDYRLAERDIIGLHHYDVFPEIRKMEQWQAIHRRCLAGETLRNEEDRICRKDGREDWLRWEIRPWIDESGMVGGIIMFTEVITARKQAEQALAEKTRELSDFVEHATVSMHWVGPDGVILWANQTELNLLGYSREEYIGRHIADFHVDKSVIQNILDRLSHDEPVQEYAARLRSKDGSIKDVIIDSSVLWKEGKFTHTRCFTRDVTERKEAEEAQRISEERFRAAYHNASVGISICDLTGRLQEVNQALCEMLGYPKEELLATDFQALTHPDDLASNLNRIRMLLAGTAVHQVFDKRYIKKDGTTVWAHMGLSVIRNHNGEPSHLLAMVHDITERKQAESRLRLTQFTIEHAADAVYWIDQTAQIVNVNEAASLMLGYSKDELCAMTVHDLNSDFQSDMWPGFWAETRQRKSVTFETFHRSKTGQLIPVEVSVNYLSYEGQELHCAFVRNITDRKNAQEELRRSKSQLTHILENSPVVVYARQVGDGWPITFITPNAYGLLGYTSVDLLSDPHRLDSLIHPDDERDLLARGMSQLLRAGACTFVYRLRHRDGIHRWIENRARLNDNGKGALQIAGTMIDVTERKKAEEALEEERHRLVMAQLLAHLGSWEWNILTGTKTWSDESYRIFGYDPGSIQPTYEIFAQAIHPQDRERVLQAARATLEDDMASCDLECRIVRPSGEVRHIHCRGEVTRNDAGRPLQMAGTVLDITERKQTQEALAQHERQLQTVLDALPVGVWFTDPSGKPLLANPAAKHIWSGIKQVGIETAANAAGWWEAIGPSSEPHRWALSHVLTKGVPSLYETLDFECLDGTKKTIRNTAVPVQDETGVVVGAIVLNEDITALRRAQEAIKLTQFSIDHAVEAFLWIGPDAKILHVNEAACRMLEYASAELTAMTVHDIDPNFPQEQWSAHWEELKRKGSLTFESKHWSRTGRVLDTEVTVNYLQYDGREYNCAIMRDIGERKRADEALRTSEERYRALYDETPTMYFTLATDGTVRSVNRFGADQLGYQVEELVGHSVLRIFHEDDKEAVSTSLSECLATPETTKHWEFRKVRKDGRIIWVRETARVGQSSAGEIVLLVTCEDTTAQKLAEAQQARQDDQLQAIFRMTLTLSRATSLDDIYREAIDCMQRALKADRASIRLFDEAGVMRFKASRGLSERYQSAVEGHSLWTSKTVDPQTILIDDISSDPSVAQYREVFDAEGIKALGFIPLVLPERLLGKFMLYYDTPHHFTEEEVGVAKTIAGHVAYMIQRTRADQALRVSEERYRSLVDNAPIGIFVNEAGRFTYVNREMQRILRATHADQLIGMPVLDRIAPEFHQIVQARIQQLIEKGQPAPTLDKQYVGLDGSRVDVAVTAIPTIFNGTPVMQVLVLDITERKQAEEALREKHTLLSTIMDATVDIIFVKDLQGRYLHMNPAGARAVGMSVEEVVGKDDDAIWPADLAACCQEADRKILASGAAQTMEESTTVDGQRVTYLTTKAPYRDAAGRMIGIIGVAHDISQMKRSEEELRRSHAFLRQVIDIDPNFVFAKDRAGRFTLVNKAVADAYGTTVENLIGKTDADFNADQKEVAFSRETDLEVLNSLQDLFLPEEVITDSMGKMRWLQTVKRPLFNEQGQAIMVLGAATDITERKRMEEALRQRERDLRAAIEERERISQDLHDGILQSLFAVGLSLETTKSMMSLKERKTSGPALKQAIDQLNRLMHEVRNFIAGLGSDLLQGTDLPTALHHMLETLTKNHPTHVRLKIEDRAAQALSAEQSLHLLLVIQEAVSNCIRHGHAQEATVSLKLLKQGVRLSVRDNGCGFDSAASKGIGHGLANMAARAQKIGGRFTVLSKTNEGTRVVLDLPKEAVLAHS